MSDAVPETDLPAGNAIGEDEETLLARHRKEKKELQAKIQGLKKAKVDKKRKKEQQDEIARMEADLETRHAEELNKLNSLKISETVESVAEDLGDVAGGESEETKQPKVSKAQRRREKKSQEDKEREAQIKAEEALNKNSPRILEDKKIAELLMKRGLVSFPVPADGDCLYNAVKHQLARIGVHDYDTADLRQMTADYIEDNKDSVIFYMTNPDTGDILDEDEFRKYCHQVRNTKAWGGEIEVKALSSRLKCPIEIIQATGTSPVHGEGENPSRKLVLTYHRHMYRLGEHYNSTLPAPVEGQEEDEVGEDDG
ncbi:AAEL002529-PA [Aedes aegypti]|uniref:AAEL002529-PA n=1 Tax=Aedes aegypti TaxID=7159 RepID=Q17HZ1_AEDAE|nr:AAEL002529-PA [Aedes aegypti]